MDAIYLLIPIALILVAIGIAIFFWAVKSDQFEDLEGPAHSILFDDDVVPPKAAPDKAAKNKDAEKSNNTQE